MQHIHNQKCNFTHWWVVAIGVKTCLPKRPLIAAIERVKSAGGPQLEFYRRDSEYLA